jgi:hypothetical protein
VHILRKRGWLQPLRDHCTIASLLTLAALVVTLWLALTLRLDGLMVLPRLTDESSEVLLGWQVARGDVLPLVGVQPYIGALYTYLVAGVFRLLGPTIAAGRLVAAIGGTLTVLATFALGRELGAAHGVSDGRQARRGLVVGLLAALLLAVSGPHILVSSRIAYSNSLTPLFTTVSVWLLQRALARRSLTAFAGSAFAFGLALQTHLAALAIAPGLALGAIIVGCGPLGHGRWRWRVAAFLVAFVALLLPLGNLLAYNAMHGLASFDWVGIRSEHYLQSEPFTLAGWAIRLVALMRAILLAIGAQASETIWPDDALASPLVVAAAALLLLGLWSLGRRRIWWPLLAVVSVTLVVSALNSRVEPIVPRVRHYAPLLPIAAVAIAEGLVWLRAWIGRRRPIGWLADPALLLGAVGLTVGAMLALGAYQNERMSRADKNNLAYLAVVEAIGRSGSRDDRVYLDSRLVDVRTLSGGRMTDHLRFAFTVQGQDFDTIDVGVEPNPLDRLVRPPRRVVLNAASVPDVSTRFQLEPLPGGPGEDAPFRAFRIMGHRTP